MTVARPRGDETLETPTRPRSRKESKRTAPSSDSGNEKSLISENTNGDALRPHECTKGRGADCTLSGAFSWESCTAGSGIRRCWSVELARACGRQHECLMERAGALGSAGESSLSPPLSLSLYLSFSPSDITRDNVTRRSNKGTRRSGRAGTGWVK